MLVRIRYSQAFMLVPGLKESRPQRLGVALPNQVLGAAVPSRRQPNKGGLSRPRSQERESEFRSIQQRGIRFFHHERTYRCPVPLKR